MDEKEKSASSAVKLILVSVGAIIVLLVVIKQLGFIPSEANAGPVGVKFQTFVPPQPQTNSQGTAELEKKVRELQESLQNANAKSLGPTGSEAPARQFSIAGYWQANPYSVQIAQLGSQVGLTLYYPNGIPGAVCQGVLNGKDLRMGCSNGMATSSAAGQVVSENRIELTDNSQGFGQRWVLVR